MEKSKNKRYDIVVGIPTYNEADSIRNTLIKIDEGLVKYYPTYRSLIINIDSVSKDKTGQIFLATKSKTSKIVLSNDKNLRGKGINIFTLLKISKKFDAKYIATIDADIVTISEKWPKLLLDPIIHHRADFVAPVYTRNRYEGNTTNHFCFPLMYAWFGRTLTQPIGGDFGMGNHFTNYVLKQSIPPSAYLYGIDIFLSTHTIGGNFQIAEVHLGKKVHKPSFTRIVPMFQQVATTMIYTLSRYEKATHKRLMPNSEQRVDDLVKRPAQAEITFLKKYAFQSLRRLSPEEVYEYLGIKPPQIEHMLKLCSLVQEDEWIKVLTGLVSRIPKSPVSPRLAVKIGTLIAPFFFLRVLSYFEELDKLSRREEIDSLILRQAQKLSCSLLKLQGENDPITQQEKFPK